MKITLKQNDYLIEFCELYGKDINEVSEVIINSLIQRNIIYDSVEFASETIEYILEQQCINLDVFCVVTFNKSSETIRNLVKNFIIWGVENECPGCGCELENYEFITKCTNCDYSECNELDYDSMPGGRDYKTDLANICNN